MLLSPAPALPAGEGWAYEVKWDGMRALVTVETGWHLHSRHGVDHTAAFPELEPLAGLNPRSRVVLDGELICLDPATGRPSFERLMARVRAKLPSAAAKLAPATFMVFDVVVADGQDLCAMPWAARRLVLEELRSAAPDPVWRINTAFADGAGLLAKTADMGLEGVVAKRTTPRYRPGQRSKDWVKAKHRSVEWMELVAWRAPSGRDAGGLVFADQGRVAGRAFPGLSGEERRRTAAILSAHGTRTDWGITLPTQVAEVQVAYLERIPGGRFREPVARAVRLAL
jgi:bifunctional non-homologous end joining protein LigD